MEWNEVGRDSLTAARDAQGRHSRSTISRGYYAFHAALTGALIEAEYQAPAKRQTPPHNAQPKLIGVHLASRGQDFVRDLRSIFRRLYRARLDADYKYCLSRLPATER